MRHPLDSSRRCPACGELAELRYDATQVLHDGYGPVRAHLMTCGTCSGTSAMDAEPMPGLTDDDLLTVLARRPDLSVVAPEDTLCLFMDDGAGTPFRLVADGVVP